MLIWDPPIHVFLSRGCWHVAYGSRSDGLYATRAEAIATAMVASARENRNLEIEETGYW